MRRLQGLNVLLLVILCATFLISAMGCAANTETPTDQRPAAAADTRENLDTRTQGSPIVFNFDFVNGPTPGSPATQIPGVQALGAGAEGDALSQFVNQLASSANGQSSEVTSPGQIYSQAGNSLTINVTSGGTTPTASGGGATGSSSAAANATVTPSTTQDVKPTFSLPVTVTAAPGSVAQGGPTQAVGEGGTGGAQTSSPNAEARAARLEAQNDTLMRLVERVLPANDVALSAETTSDEKDTSTQ